MSGSIQILTWIPLKVYNRFSGHECVSNNYCILSAGFYHGGVILSGKQTESSPNCKVLSRGAQDIGQTGLSRTDISI